MKCERISCTKEATTTATFPARPPITRFPTVLHVCDEHEEAPEQASVWEIDR